MKKVHFIRHGMPADPYTDYSKLSFEKICDLATQKFSPDIHINNKDTILEKFSKEKLNSYDLILCSPSERTRQTAELFQSLSKHDLEIKIEETLKEIYSSYVGACPDARLEEVRRN